VSGTTERSKHADRLSRARGAVEAAQRYLLSIQQEDGHWCGELEGDTILESEYILTMHYLGLTDDGRVEKAANYIRRLQLPDGGWAIFPGGPPEASASVKAYFVLKLVGDDPEAPHMQRARQAILDLGGIEACNSFTKLYLALFGQYDWERCPAVLPEIILLPRWFYINIYEMSSWSRAIIVPLSVIRAHKPRCAVPEHANIPELYSDKSVPPKSGLWANLFHALDRGLRMLERWAPVKPTRSMALKECEKWILERLEGSDGLGAIFPPIVNTIIALRCLGYPQDHPTVQGQIRELQKLEIEDDEIVKVQPCFSPTWDTALAVNALVESGLDSDHPDLQRAASWLLGKRGTPTGDWRVKVEGVEKPGWYFEYANPYYPDCDTTSKVITALSKVRLPDDDQEAAKERAIHEGHEWHVSMQNADGGWGAFDKDCNKEILCHVPFADHNAMIDPSTSDLTARGLETLAALGHDREFPAARRAIDFLLAEQETDGSWYGRWGCNYLYGTWLALWGLKSIGHDTRGVAFRRAARWLKECQSADGGWGELPLSYEDPSHKGRGPSTASQTAWAVMGLLAADEGDSEAVRRGVEYLTTNQEEDGSWEEEFWTGTGFPSVFYLRYHLYRIYFPLLALATYLENGSSTERHETESVTV
jgi:squalene-hopene/tetraprenyl-beta-curcumene cyclase